MGVLVEVAGRELAVRFVGIDRWSSLSRGVTFPLAAVTAARAVPRADAMADRPRLRMPGTFLPGRLVAGVYRAPGRRAELWCVHRGEELLTISLTGQPYGRVVVEVDEPAAAARVIEIARTNAG